MQIRAASSNTSDVASTWVDGSVIESKHTNQMQKDDTFDANFPYGGGGRGGSVLMGDLKNGGHVQEQDSTADAQSEFTAGGANDVQETASQIVSSTPLSMGLAKRGPAKRTASYSGMSPGRAELSGNANSGTAVPLRGTADRKHSAGALPYGSGMLKQGSILSMEPGRVDTNEEHPTMGGAAASGTRLRSASQLSSHSAPRLPAELDGGSSSDEAMTQGTISPTRKAKKSK